MWICFWLHKEGRRWRWAAGYPSEWIIKQWIVRVVCCATDFCLICKFSYVNYNNDHHHIYTLSTTVTYGTVYLAAFKCHSEFWLALMLFVVPIFQKQDEGVVLLDQVCDHLGLQERRLFSLQIRESSTAIASITANMHSPVSSLFICCTFGDEIVTYCTRWLLFRW